MKPEYDLLVIGGGINGCGIARDAAGRGLSVCLAEMNDIGSATSASSTKLFHGGLRYLEYFEVRLVREALIERETLLRAMPHIAWPMRFVLPYHKSMRFDGTTPTSKILNTVMPWMKGRRPAWLIRMGLFMYDNLGGRQILPGTRSLSLRGTPEGKPLKQMFARAYEYSDCWVEDSRLVVLNARDAEARGATIEVRSKVVSADVVDGIWHVILEDAEGRRDTRTARMVVNAAGPWVGDVLRGTLKSNSQGGVRLVRGSHIVTKRLFDHDKCYFFQGTDGRIIFAIPYETDFTLIGTTDAEHEDASEKPVCTPEEQRYLVDFINGYLADPISTDDIVWTYSGVRPLYDDGAKSATAATRDYVIKLDRARGAPALNIFGGKITTYRRLAESALKEIGTVFEGLSGPWTAGVPLPGGDFPHDGVARLIADLRAAFPFLSERWATRMIRAYGTEAATLLQGATTAADLGRDFGATLTEREVDWLIAHEYVRRADDVVWRRSKLGLRMSKPEISVLDDWIRDRVASALSAAAE
ncbi:glycerol-3-phosphate dehydrogenase [Sulfitobacter albidus]|uniref:Glycerol-3-phosphate dehydrogenase n=1 Tax=Sulfitobacter albidus TaxID=2829501 RepID=A0A975JEF4_9RHOB|nr:glycerol-3-phosphate dehydrogenase [Sulfitobacter albidus]QUJ76736.1 glycerol-3-phosphate dehydrogenase [Sulfitobacter albidus]